MVKLTYIFIPAQLISNAANSITTKITLQQESTGYNNIRHYYDKPFWQSLIMTTAMSFALVVRHFWDSNGKGPHKPTPMKIRFLLAVPALCDLIAATLNIYGLAFINLSIFQMLRSSQIIFTAILSFFVLKKKIKAYEILGICLVVVSLILVDESSNHGTVKEKLLGSLLVTFGQIFIQYKLKGKVGALEVI